MAKQEIDTETAEVLKTIEEVLEHNLLLRKTLDAIVCELKNYEKHLEKRLADLAAKRKELD